MRAKLKLDLEKLDVDSFQTENLVVARKGTVHAHGPTGTTGGPWSVNPDNTCGQATCQAVVTCIGETCGGCGTAHTCIPLDTEGVCVWTLYCD